MKRIIPVTLLMISVLIVQVAVAPVPAVAEQEPATCSTTAGFQRLDFWLGHWDVYVGDRKVGENHIEKILEGMVEKFKTENCLLQQVYIRNEDLTIQDLLHEKIASLGENIVVRRFERWERGESID